MVVVIAVVGIVAAGLMAACCKIPTATRCTFVVPLMSSMLSPSAGIPGTPKDSLSHWYWKPYQSTW